MEEKTTARNPHHAPVNVEIPRALSAIPTYTPTVTSQLQRYRLLNDRKKERGC